ncbi:hypothetical protein B0H67DRAFT_136551 [Lasiosphaeris hirsuta]|uniref:Uncharacterized protein n=1 Tax=Lasiosphaeris hirsuta TaxID=260670 RepID=A0AA40B0W9_9PEZI|nr:hypothetical protein B0H67DRAFT_136551 [Lasiosphaeris hirsuta]
MDTPKSALLNSPELSKILDSPMDYYNHQFRNSSHRQQGKSKQADFAFVHQRAEQERQCAESEYQRAEHANQVIAVLVNKVQQHLDARVVNVVLGLERAGRFRTMLRVSDRMSWDQSDLDQTDGTRPRIQQDQMPDENSD